ncbi:MAG: serine hydrolase [Bryobacteraceae bacterium]
MTKAIALAALIPVAALSYPLDGAAKTGIRRLVGYKEKIKLPPGALLTSDRVKLHLAAFPSFDIAAETPRDPRLQKGLEAIFAKRDRSYSLALLDITDPAHPRYAALREDVKRIPGSVGKLFVATGFFAALARAHSPVTEREAFLRDTVIEASDFVHVDGKTVPFYDPAKKTLINRRLQTGDRFNLYEWLDHMLSQSSNAAAAETWKQTMLLDRFPKQYPLPKAEIDRYFQETPKTELAAQSLSVNEDALRAAGLNTDNLRIGTFFTRNGGRAVPGTASYASPGELLRWLVKLEQGKIVDPWSSLEIKKLLYFSRPRYRYSSSPALSEAAVYFKSGSLFECAPEPGFQCGQYRGNKLNLMHSVAIVESGAKVYLVALTSNVLKLNSAYEHQTIGTLIERLIQAPGE